MEFMVNVPTCVGSSEYSTLAFCEELRWADQRSFGVAMEELEFDGLAVPDHLQAGNGPTSECLVTTTALAGATDDVRLYPKTINNHLRHGPLLAKATAMLDVVSDGRLTLGMGAGWKEDEARAFGYDWPDAPSRLRELEETIEVLKLLWTGDDETYDGDYVDIEGADGRPHPVQDPHPPVMVGGGGEEFTLRITAKHADVWNYWGPVDLMAHKLDVLESHCETYDREYDAITKSWFARCLLAETDEGVEELLDAVPRFKPEHIGDTEFALAGTPAEVAADVERFRDIGIEEVVVEFVDFPGTEGAELFADEVAPEFA